MVVVPEDGGIRDMEGTLKGVRTEKRVEETRTGLERERWTVPSSTEGSKTGGRGKWEPMTGAK